MTQRGCGVVTGVSAAIVSLRIGWRHVAPINRLVFALLVGAILDPIAMSNSLIGYPYPIYGLWLGLIAGITWNVVSAGLSMTKTVETRTEESDDST